jgi:hypothetical protein
MQMSSGEYDNGYESLVTLLKESKALKIEPFTKMAQEQLNKLDSKAKKSGNSNEDNKTVSTVD